MEALESGLTDVFQAIQGVAADVKNQGALDTLMKFPVDIGEKISVRIRGAEIACAMIGKGQGIRTVVDLGFGKIHGHFEELTHYLFHPVGLEERGYEKFLDTENVVPERPGAEHLANHSSFTSDFIFEQLQRLERNGAAGLFEKVRRDTTGFVDG
jgi:hypothetical protein